VLLAEVRSVQPHLVHGVVLAEQKVIATAAKPVRRLRGLTTGRRPVADGVEVP
jgi:hypothetical protein